MDKKQRRSSRGPIKDTICIDNDEYHDGGPWAETIHEATMYAFATHDEDDSYEDFANNNGDHSASANSESYSERFDGDEDGSMVETDPPQQLHSRKRSEGIRRVDRSLVHLGKLRQLLEEQEHREGVPYPFHPPPFDPKNQEDSNSKLRSLTEVRKTTIQGIASSTRTKEFNNPDHKLSSFATTTMEKKKNTFKSSSRARKHRSISENRYALIAFDSDDDSVVDNKNYHPDGDAPVHTHEITDTHIYPVVIPYDSSLSFEDGSDPQEYENMDTMRLLIRLHASRSDLHAKKARLLAAQHQWLPAAGVLQESIADLSHGLKLANTAISMVVFDTDLDNANSTDCISQKDVDSYQHDVVVPIIRTEAFADHRRAQLERDAAIISVSSHYLVTQKDQYLKAAHRQVSKLERRLKPMWKHRDAAKKRFGDEKWKRNTKRQKGFFAKARHKYEQELENLEKALTVLQDSFSDADSLMDKASLLQEKLRQIRITKNRYNGIRPTLPKPTVDDHGREMVTCTSYFDPQADEFGWTFTGSIDRDDSVQFFEKWVKIESKPKATCLSNRNNDVEPNTSNHNSNIDEKGTNFVLVKLDVYFETGAVQTVVEYPALCDSDGTTVHPAWLSTLYFNNDDDDENCVNPDLYHQILTDPLSAHRLHNCTNVALLKS